MATSAAPNPSKQSAERQAMDAPWTLIGDILDGADCVRSKTAYLPKYEDEGQAEYDRRRKAAPWRPEFADALRSLASKPFDQDIGLKGDVSDRIKAIAEDIDGRGNSLTRYSAEGFEKAIAKGLHCILVDYPSMDPAATRAQEQEAGARPYWIHIEASDIVALYTSWVGGREIVEHFRYRETATVRDGFTESTVERIRIYEPGIWEVWEKAAGEKDWTQVDAGPINRSGKTDVPLVMLFTGERLGEMKVRPPLAALAAMQIELLQALSRQDEVLTYAGSPMLAAEGMAAPQDGSAIAVGPKRVMYAPPGGEGSTPKWSFIQPDAANIAEIRNHTKSIIDDMRRLGMQPLTQASGTPTATGQSIEAAKAHSAVEAWAMALKDALEQAFVYTCEWMGEDANVECIVSTDFDVVPFAQAPLTALAAARAAKDISQRTFWDGLRRFDVLPQDFDADTEEETLAEELQGLEPDEVIDPVTGAPIDDLASLFGPDVLSESAGVA